MRCPTASTCPKWAREPPDRMCRRSSAAGGGSCCTFAVARAALTLSAGSATTVTIPIGLWYNPNVHPFREHELRRDSALKYAGIVGLERLWDEPYEMPQFLRLVTGHERFRERCRVCYRAPVGADRAARRQNGFDASRRRCWSASTRIRRPSRRSARRWGGSMACRSCSRTSAAVGPSAADWHVSTIFICSSIAAAFTVNGSATRERWRSVSAQCDDHVRS